MSKYRIVKNDLNEYIAQVYKYKKWEDIIFDYTPGYVNAIYFKNKETLEITLDEYRIVKENTQLRQLRVQI